MQLLKFGKGNAKLGKNVHTFTLPAGHTCPSARYCLSYADKVTGKIKDGKDTEFRCFAASSEALYTNLRNRNWYNLSLLKRSKNMAKLIQASLPKNAEIIRIHVGGDFFSEEYFDAWLIVACDNPQIKFYFYTKNISWWKKREHLIGNGHKPGILFNVVPTASYGGKEDKLIEEYGFRYAFVVFSENEAKYRGFPIDHDDSHAMFHGDNFTLLLHGIQPKGTEANIAYQLLRKNGQAGYSRKSLVVV